MRVTIDRAGRLVLPKAIREAAGLTGGREAEVRLSGGVVEIEPIQPVVRLRKRPGRLPVLEVEGDGEVEPMTDDDVRRALEAQREERAERWR
jgi:AbrB family looped-hinge helix DNA binding protein